MTVPLHGLVAAAHTPFSPQGDLDLDAVEAQAAHLLRQGVTAVFVAGSTGESHSLTVGERLALARRWAETVRGAPLRLVVHVGANCLEDACTLAADAERAGADAVAALAPGYFRPRDVSALADCCARIAGAAPSLPFYFYDIPALTGVNLPMPDFLDAASARVPTLAGIKFTNPDLAAYQRCLRAAGGRFDVPWGIDEALLAAWAVGARGAVGSTYNFAARVSLRAVGALERGDLDAARAEQWRTVELVRVLAGFGYLAACKALMGLLGVPVGPVRLPNAPLAPERTADLRDALDALGFWEW